MKRIVAANRIITPDSGVVSLGGVELENREVSRVSRLDGEQTFTEWLGGTISIRRSADGTMAAYKDGILLTA